MDQVSKELQSHTRTYVPETRENIIIQRHESTQTTHAQHTSSTTLSAPIRHYPAARLLMKPRSDTPRVCEARPCVWRRHPKVTPMPKHNILYSPVMWWMRVVPSLLTWLAMLSSKLKYWLSRHTDSKHAEPQRHPRAHTTSLAARLWLLSCGRAQHSTSPRPDDPKSFRSQATLCRSEHC